MSFSVLNGHNNAPSVVYGNELIDSDGYRKSVIDSPARMGTEMDLKEKIPSLWSNFSCVRREKSRGNDF